MKLPPLRAVQCFESVARLNSFSQAANALNVTQSAISHQVRLLEEYLGETLFVRQGRRLSLTPMGEKYFDDISHSLQNIASASQQIREGESGKIRLAMYSSLAVKWLVPRLENLRQQHPEIDLSLNMFADEPAFTDQVADCFITSYPPEKNYVSDFLYKELLYPFCSQKVWQQIQDKPLPDALWGHPLLSVDSIFKGEAEDWLTWCKRGGFSLPRNVKINHFSHMVLAAEAVKYHQGIAFLNDYFLNDQDHQNLVRIPMHELPTGENLYFVYKKSRAKQFEIKTLGGWLKQQCFVYESD
ncbi:LysR substrate-binding domain-containing protein [Photobacterium makurazakiensis]|uniref:LysR substrate-binding domain-containing protein n=1 Tax=Photobacterium makurazakiensis TaxID=2910234 RepID=UPI003D1003D7